MGNCVRRGHKALKKKKKEGVLVLCGCVLWEGALFFFRLGMAVLKGEKGRYQRADFVV